MILDYLDRSAAADIETDVCIIGAGPAGLSIACALEKTGVAVCLLESGGWTGNRTAQELCAGDSIGEFDFDPASVRLRAFGGCLRIWGGGCLPLTPMDLAVRDWVPDSGWPIGYDSLAPYYQRARTIFGIDGTLVRGAFAGTPARLLPAYDDPAVIHRVSISSYADPSTYQRDDLERAPHVQLVVNATVVECVPLANGSAVSHVVLQARDGRRNVVRARHFVLACGGIENARLLLLSDSVVPGGLGNDRDQVGRRFMDHPSVSLGRVVGGDTHRVTRPFEGSSHADRTPRFAHICVSDEAQRALRMLNARVRTIAVEAEPPAGIAALRALRRSRQDFVLTEGELIEQHICEALKLRPRGARSSSPANDPLWRLALRAGVGAGDLLHALARRLRDRRTVAVRHVELFGFFEQAPNQASRVVLGDALDALGQRRVRVDWQLTPLDIHSYRMASRLFGETIARAAGGRFERADWLSEDDVPPPVQGTAHHIGTTRMADDPRNGVVDRHCRVHGIDNLHVAGSSVFPTGGWAFPTFTIAALSLRLADHLRLRLAAERPLWVSVRHEGLAAEVTDSHATESSGERLH